MCPRELNIDEFNALNYLSQRTPAVGILEVNSIPVLRGVEFLNSLHSCFLTSNAIAYIEDVSEEKASPKNVDLIMKNGESSYSITEAGKRYVEYYLECILSNDR